MAPTPALMSQSQSHPAVLAPLLWGLKWAMGPDSHTQRGDVQLLNPGTAWHSSVPLIHSNFSEKEEVGMAVRASGGVGVW